MPLMPRPRLTAPPGEIRLFLTGPPPIRAAGPFLPLAAPSITVRSHKINTAIVACLEHVATCTSPPGVGAADFLLRLLDDEVYALDEVDEVTVRVGIIIRGITERHNLIQGHPPAPVATS